MSAPPGILIIRLSSLGDILHALPAFADLRAAFPDSKIDWLVSEKHKLLVSAVSGINTIRIFESASRLPHLIRELRRQHYEFAIDFQGLLKSAALGFMSGARTRLGFSRDLAREFPAHWCLQPDVAESPETISCITIKPDAGRNDWGAAVSASPDFASPKTIAIVESCCRKKS